jgi:hypothetical protein
VSVAAVGLTERAQVMRGDLPVQWEWQDDDGVSWAPYSEAVSFFLERQHAAGSAQVLLGGRQGWVVDIPVRRGSSRVAAPLSLGA